MLDQGLYFLMLLGILGLAWNTLAYFKTVTSNAFSGRDYRRVLFSFVLGALLVWGLVIPSFAVATLSAALIWLAALIVVAVLATELIQQASAYQRPGSIAYTPLLIRYWPAWVVKERHVVVGKTTVIEFKLIESALDLKLVQVSKPGKKADQAGFAQPAQGSSSIRLSDLDQQEIQERVQQDMRYPLSKHDEQAIVESGYFLRKRAIVRLVCDAPGFEPQTKEIRTDIHTLTEKSVSFALLPTESGERFIVFNLMGTDDTIKGTITVQCKVAKSSHRIVEVLPTLAVLSTILGLVSTAIIIVEKFSGLLH